MTVVIKLGYFYWRFITVRKWKIDFLRPTCNLKTFFLTDLPMISKVIRRDTTNNQNNSDIFAVLLSLSISLFADYHGTNGTKRTPTASLQVHVCMRDRKLSVFIIINFLNHHHWEKRHKVYNKIISLGESFVVYCCK